MKISFDFRYITQANRPRLFNEKDHKVCVYSLWIVKRNLSRGPSPVGLHPPIIRKSVCRSE
jgi:hypothetical protein